MGQRSGCASGARSDQLWHPPVLIGVCTAGTEVADTHGYPRLA
ncbi:MAG: hypothetical protein AB2693_26365 [Candidatus Thiodiazotropha sp.]